MKVEDIFEWSCIFLYLINLVQSEVLSNTGKHILILIVNAIIGKTNVYY